MALVGRDSAFPPNADEAAAAAAAGVRVWFGYLGGAGAFHRWSPEDFAVLRAAGLRSTGIWVPAIDLSDDPTTGAIFARQLSEDASLVGSVIIDTEASMRGNRRLLSYVDTFTAAVRRAPGWASPVYGGANYVGGNPAWWIIPGAPPPGQARQYGGGAVVDPADASRRVAVDNDLIDEAFPLAAWTEGGSVIAEAFTDVNDARRTQIREWYAAYLGQGPGGREPESDQIIQSWLGVWAARGGEAVRAAIYDSGEAQARRAREAGALERGPAPTG